MIFRQADRTAPHCPHCGQPAAIQHWRLSRYAHHCPKRGQTVFWEKR